MKRELFTIPNLLSILRMLLPIPFTLVMLSSMPDARWWGVGIIALGVLTDKLDGDLARWLHCETEWGRILDPLADKVGVAAIALVLLWLGLVPAWFVILLLVRDLLILVGGLYIKKTRGLVLPSNWAGKWAVGVIGFTLLFALIDNTMLIVQIGTWLSVAMVGVSTAMYVQRFVSVIRTER
jgi:cardiolipin synthase (CMP-forming)